MATAPFLAFTDADCVPSLDWLREGVRALEGSELATGPILPDPDAELGPFDRTLAVAAPSPLFESANLFIRRELFDRVGGFRPPERLPLPIERGHFGEDVVFGWRALRLGAKREFAAGAVVFHEVVPRGARGYIAERTRLRLFPWLVREVPEIRRSLPLGVFLSPRTRRFDLALVGVLLAATMRRLAPLLLTLPYAFNDLPRGSPWRRSALRRNAAYVLADLVGLGSLLRGAAETRSPLL